MIKPCTTCLKPQNSTRYIMLLVYLYNKAFISSLTSSFFLLRTTTSSFWFQRTCLSARGWLYVTMNMPSSMTRHWIMYGLDVSMPFIANYWMFLANHYK